MNHQPSIAITIIGHNEIEHLRELLPTLHWADEVIYVDCESSNRSFEFATSQGCKVYARDNNPNLNINKAFAMEKAHSDWIFYLDPDERISPDLAEDILQHITHPGENRAFTMNRRNHFFGKWLRHGSQYPDQQLRLFQRGFASFPLKHVHERLSVSGKTGYLDKDLLHYPYLSITQYLQKFDFYTSFEARFLLQQGVRPGILRGCRYLLCKPAWRFVRRYFFKFGFLDGWPGLFAAVFDALNFMVRYFKLIEIYRQEQPHR